MIALLLIQALVEDQVHHPSDTGAPAIAITDNEDPEPIHSPNQITAVLTFSTCLLYPRGEEAEPLFVCLFF